MRRIDMPSHTHSADPYQLISIDDAAELLAVCKRSVERRIAEGELPQPLKVGGSSRLRRKDIVAYIERLAERAVAR